jgi:hypothetical protein
MFFETLQEHTTYRTHDPVGEIKMTILIGSLAAIVIGYLAIRKILDDLKYL